MKTVLITLGGLIAFLGSYFFFVAYSGPRDIIFLLICAFLLFVIFRSAWNEILKNGAKKFIIISAITTVVCTTYFLYWILIDLPSRI